MVNSYVADSRFRVDVLVSWAAQFLLALSALYALLFVASSAGETFFVLENRGMVRHVVGSVIFSSSVDVWVWGLGLLFASLWVLSRLMRSQSGRLQGVAVAVPLTLLMLAGLFSTGGLLALATLSLLCIYFWFAHAGFGLSRLGLARNLAFGAVGVLVFVEAAALFLFNVPAVAGFGGQFSSFGVHWRLVELSFFNLTYVLLPFEYLAFAVLGVVVFVALVLPFGRLHGWISRFAGQLGRLGVSCKSVECGCSGGRFPLSAALVVSVALSSLLVAVTVLPWVNPTFRLVSVDAPNYYEWIVKMRGTDANSALSFALTNDRATFLVLQYALSFVVDPVILLQYMPALLIPLLCVVSMLVLRSFVGLRDAAVFSVLLAPFSLQSLALIYSGYFANVLAVVLVYAYFVVFVHIGRSWSNVRLLALLVISVGVLFSHSWTWFVFAVSLGGFLLLEWRSTTRVGEGLGVFKGKAVLVVATIAVGLVCDFSRKLLGSGSSSASVLATAQSSLALPNPAFLVGGMRTTVNFYLGGVFANQLMFLLFVAGFLFLLTFKSEISRLLISWVFVGCVSMVFASGVFVFNRFLFLMPSVVFGGLGLAFVVRLVGCSVRITGRGRLLAEFLVVGLVFLCLLNVSLRYLSNLNLL